jgi:replicative DNA helicase
MKTEKPVSQADEILNLPHNIDAEQAMIGCCLLAGEAPTIKPEMMYRNGHRLIVEALQSMASMGTPIDLVTTWEYLRAKQLIETVGGATYLAGCCESTANPKNLGAYQKMLARLHNQRALRIKCAQLSTMAGSATTADAQHIIRELESVIDAGCSDTITCVPMLAGLKNVIEEIEINRNRGDAILGLSTGLVDLDRVISGLCPSDLIVVAARPGMGKTALATGMASNAAMAGHTTLFFSLEMSAKQLHYRMLSMMARVDLLRLRTGQINDHEHITTLRAGERLATLPLLINDTGGISDAEIRAEAKKIRPSLIVVDYLQLITPSKTTDRRDLDIAGITRNLKAMAKELNVPTVLLSQLNRKVEERTGKASRRPFLSDLRDSGAIEQDADVVMFIYRDEAYNPNSADAGIAEINIAKQRNGPTSLIPVRFEDYCARFSDLGHDDIAAFWRRRK